MAGASLLALLDDIASVLDDVALMTRTAAKKTAGVLGDDLALNAQQVAGVRAERELPVVFAVATGSVKNKVILVPLALLISAWAPWAIVPLLMLGGLYLCFEGVEKLSHSLLHRSQKQAEHAEVVKALRDPGVDMVAFEKTKIKGAIRTDFILSAEIIVIALGSVKDASLGAQIAVLTGVALLMTVGVYALVAAIVKMDDAGVALLNGATAKTYWSAFKRWLGSVLLQAAPYLMKTLSVVGTIAMFMVGGGILVHGAPGSHDLLHHAGEVVAAIPMAGAALAVLMPSVINIAAGVLAGAMALMIVGAASGILGRLSGQRK